MVTTQNLLGDSIIKLLGLESLPNEEKAMILDKMTELIQKRVMLRLIENLSEEDAQTIANSQMSQTEMVAFAAEKVANFDAILNEEIIKAKQEMLNATEQVG
ncbi:MAG: hypothetical protein UT02_C0006G0007 [Parcubacteria group bacterium GW2011_GWC2_38_7]|nr:MAG: hypothetical protein UT02_C0006G0007 [Parcubacteria group bacterium GW2011_GWC2_38_7]